MATAAQLAIAKRLVAEFASLSDILVDPWIEDAILEVSTTAFGVNTDKALAYMAGHLYAMNQRAANAALGSLGGPLTTKSARSWSVGFAGPRAGSGDSNSELSETTYGRLFMGLRQRLGIGFGTVLC